MKYPQFWLNASPKRKRIYSVIFVFLLAVLFTVLGVIIPASPVEEKMVYDQLNSTLTQGTATNTLPIAIFRNNFLLCLAMFIPLAGLPFGLFLMFSTGQGFRAVFDLQASGAIPTPAAPPDLTATTAFLVLAFAGLTFLLEYASYSIGMTESVWLYRRITQHRWKRELKTTAIMIGVVALLLTIGAIVESIALYLGM